MTFVHSRVFNAITAGADYLETHHFDNWILTTLKGAANIISGSTQYLLGHAFKCSKYRKYHTVQSAAHIERGARVFKQGMIEFLPGAAGIALGLLAGKYICARSLKTE